MIQTSYEFKSITNPAEDRMLSRLARQRYEQELLKLKNTEPDDEIEDDQSVNRESVLT